MIKATQQQADDMIVELLNQRKEYIAMIVDGKIAVMSSVVFIDSVLAEYVEGYVPDYSEISLCTTDV